MHTPYRLRRLVAAAAVFTALSPAVADAATVPDSGTWQATLAARDLQGQAVLLGSAEAVFIYDRTLNVTWLRQASSPSPMNWATATAWAQAQTMGGFTGWRLPRSLDTGFPGCTLFTYQGGDCGYNVPVQVGGATNELAHLFHVTLGNLAAYTPEGVFRGDAGEGLTWGLANTGTFQGLLEGPYWTRTVVSNAPDWVFVFNTRFGLQTILDKPRLHQVLLLRDGDVLASSVPEPGTAWLLASGAVLMGCWRRRSVGRRP